MMNAVAGWLRRVADKLDPATEEAPSSVSLDPQWMGEADFPTPTPSVSSLPTYGVYL